MFADFFFHSLDIFVTQNKSDLHSLSGRKKLNEILCDHYECIVVGRHVHIAILVVVVVASASQLIHFVCSLNRLFVCSFVQIVILCGRSALFVAITPLMTRMHDCYLHLLIDWKSSFPFQLNTWNVCCVLVLFIFSGSFCVHNLLMMWTKKQQQQRIRNNVAIALSMIGKCSIVSFYWFMM